MPKRTYTKQELNQIWIKLDANNDSKVTLRELLQKSQYVQQTIPSLIQDFDSLAVKGELDR